MRSDSNNVWTIVVEDAEGSLVACGRCQCRRPCQLQALTPLAVYSSSSSSRMIAAKLGTSRTLWSAGDATCGASLAPLAAYSSHRRSKFGSRRRRRKENRHNSEQCGQECGLLQSAPACAAPQQANESQPEQNARQNFGSVGQTHARARCRWCWIATMQMWDFTKRCSSSRCSFCCSWRLYPFQIGFVRKENQMAQYFQ
jgi:hypothetical protein